MHRTLAGINFSQSSQGKGRMKTELATHDTVYYVQTFIEPDVASLLLLYRAATLLLYTTFCTLSLLSGQCVISCSRITLAQRSFHIYIWIPIPKNYHEIATAFEIYNQKGSAIVSYFLFTGLHLKQNTRIRLLLLTSHWMHESGHLQCFFKI